ncbi:MAG: alpha-N-acetylglucosaminidase C-terminal domain-containing protein [Planctomycetota bacterium]|nr:alpha-N-acetylglucosaminidase C-terminal domain-containing protein [Planctomycetota bacterium]
MISSYYLPRWEVFFRMTADAMKAGRPLDGAKYGRMLDEMAWDWTQNGRIEGQVKPTGDSCDIAGLLFEKYAGIILNRESRPGDVVGMWGPEIPAKKFEVRSWTLERPALKPGGYIVTFTFSGGRDALRMKNVRLLSGDTEIAADRHEGWAGDAHRGNTFILNVQQEVSEKAVLEAEIGTATDGGMDSTGAITLKAIVD